ncbi:hypothetical protein BT96DRAFT_1018683 [Gymnopus androsaceus JB14]|uniref:Pali-domain-containing protein n=1 Tax=Gymnopus androsaceus JB14 TaxID=1447944 RepID=A0A6A4HSI2_9AGAR|nr:hypothetical protein BT96DRAFT_1018683 [Gymnopus androsaceus JB14]
MKAHHKPLKAYPKISIICVILLLAAFVLLLLVGLSLPIIHPVYIIQVFAPSTNQPATSSASELRFGVWGVCAYSQLNPPSVLHDDGLCYGPKLGYANVIPTSLLSEIGLTQTEVDGVLEGLLGVLILHIIAAGFSFVSLFTSLFLASHGMTIFSLVLTIITALLSTIVFVVDAVIVGVAKSHIPTLTGNGLAVNVGNAVWLVLGALIASWLGIIFLSARACYCCGVRRKRYIDDGDEYSNDNSDSNND